MLASLWRKGSLSTLLVGMQMVQPLWKTVWNFLKKLKMELLFDPAIPLLGIHPRILTHQFKRPMHLYAHNSVIYNSQVLETVLFTIAKCWKQPKCPSVNEWIKKLVHLHNGTLHSRRKQGAPTLCGRMDRIGGYYAK